MYFQILMGNIFRIHDTKACRYIFERETHTAKHLYSIFSICMWKKAVSACVTVSEHKMKGDLNVVKEPY